MVSDGIEARAMGDEGAKESTSGTSAKLHANYSQASREARWKQYGDIEDCWGAVKEARA